MLAKYSKRNLKRERFFRNKHTCGFSFMFATYVLIITDGWIHIYAHPNTAHTPRTSRVIWAHIICEHNKCRAPAARPNIYFMLRTTMIARRSSLWFSQRAIATRFGLKRFCKTLRCLFSFSKNLVQKSGILQKKNKNCV